MTKLENVFLLDNENEIELLNKLKNDKYYNDFGYFFMNDTVIKINYPNYMFQLFNQIICAFQSRMYNDYDLTQNQIKTLKSISIKVNKLIKQTEKDSK